MILRGQVFSKTLQMETSIAVIVPTGFDRDRLYKIAYLLHGTCGSGPDLIDYTMLPVYAADYPVIIVIPSAVRSVYADMAYGQRYFTYITQELPQICKSVFNISSERDDTIVIGNSVGGYGALKCALTYPERYGVCCAKAPGPVFLKDFLRELDEKGRTSEMIHLWGEQFINDYRAAFGEHFDWSPDIEPIELAKRVQQRADSPRILVQIGTEDSLLDLNRRIRDEMHALPLDFTYEEMPGAHDWFFFDKAQKRALAFATGER